MNSENNNVTFRTKKNLIWIWIIVVVAIMIGVTGYYAFYYQKNNSNIKEATGANITFSPIAVAGIIIESKTSKYINNQKEWANFVSMYNQSGGSSPEINIDFTTQELVAVAMGSQSSGGYDIKINKIIENDTQIIVYVTESSPGTSCMTTTMITYPSQFVTIPKTDKPIDFNISQKTNSCL